MLSLKLAEASCAQEITGEHPVMLLDDVLSELDASRPVEYAAHPDASEADHRDGL